MTIFIGIDLAWQGNKNPSGVAVLVGDSNGIRLEQAPNSLANMSDVITFVQDHSTADTVIAVDAPLIITNPDGQRPCEQRISQRFGRANAGAHSSNLRKYPNACSVQLTQVLINQGFRHCPNPHAPALPGRWFFEVYPHPAHVVLFGRTKIIKYKKGRVRSRRCGLAKFRRSIQWYLGKSTPRLLSTEALSRFVDQPLLDLRGRALKQYEDGLDALFCAYLASYFWRWSYERNEMIGDMTSGYIINPMPIAA